MRKVLCILGQLTDQEVEWLAASGRRRTVSRGETIITMGKPLDAVFFLLSGEMSVTVEGVGEIARLKSGEIMGEMSFIDAGPPSATVTAASESKVLEIPRTVMNEKLVSDVAFAAHFYRAIATFLSDRLRKTVTTLGYGGKVNLEDEGALPDELDGNVLDNVFLAGARFDRMLKTLMGDA